MELKEVKALQQRENERESKHQLQKKNEIIIMGADLCGGGGKGDKRGVV